MILIWPYFRPSTIDVASLNGVIIRGIKMLPTQPIKFPGSIFGYCLIIYCIFILGCSREREEYWNGRGQAENDLGLGLMRIAYVDGEGSPYFWDYTALLKNRYGISWTVFSLPANSDAAKAWVRGYNEIALTNIYRKYGTNVLVKTMAEVQKLHDH